MDLTRLRIMSVLMLLSLISTPLAIGSHPPEATSDTVEQNVESDPEDVYIIYIRNDQTIFFLWKVTADENDNVDEAKLDLRKKIEKMEACTGNNYSIKDQYASKDPQSRVLDSMPTSPALALDRLGYPRESYRYPDAQSIGVSLKLSDFRNNRTRTLHGFDLDRDDLLIVQQLPPRGQQIHTYDLKSIPEPSFDGHITPVSYPYYLRLLHGVVWAGPQDFHNGTPRIFLTNETKIAIANITGPDMANITHQQTGDELQVKQKPYDCEKVLTEQELEERLKIETRNNDTSKDTKTNNTSTLNKSNASSNNESSSEAVPGFTLILALVSIVLALVVARTFVRE